MNKQFYNWRKGKFINQGLLRIDTQNLPKDTLRDKLFNKTGGKIIYD